MSKEELKEWRRSVTHLAQVVEPGRGMPFLPSKERGKGRK